MNIIQLMPFTNHSITRRILCLPNKNIDGSYSVSMSFTISAWKLISFGDRELGSAENFAIADLTIFI